VRHGLISKPLPHRNVRPPSENDDPVGSHLTLDASMY